MSGLKPTGVEFRRVAGPAAFGRVAVLHGGDSAEREISLMTGRAVLAALRRRGIDADGFDPAGHSLHALAEGSFDRVWIALHGPGGEDGTMQGALEWLGLPYTGSGVLGSAICMDKLRTKLLAAANGIDTPPFVHVHSAAELEQLVPRLGLPLAMKPATQGSSVGLSKVEREADLLDAWRAAVILDPVVIAEKWINGREYTVGVLQGESLPPIRIETPRTFYDYQAKYFADDTRYHIPCGLAPGDEARLQRAALGAFRAAGAEGWGRVDFMMADDGVPLLLEVNTVPGMTDHSLLPMAARAVGIDFDELCWRILETSFAREPA